MVITPYMSARVNSPESEWGPEAWSRWESSRTSPLCVYTGTYSPASGSSWWRAGCCPPGCHTCDCSQELCGRKTGKKEQGVNTILRKFLPKNTEQRARKRCNEQLPSKDGALKGYSSSAGYKLKLLWGWTTKTHITQTLLSRGTFALPLCHKAWYLAFSPPLGSPSMAGEDKSGDRLELWCVSLA